MAYGSQLSLQHRYCYCINSIVGYTGSRVDCLTSPCDGSSYFCYCYSVDSTCFLYVLGWVFCMLYVLCCFPIRRYTGSPSSPSIARLNRLLRCFLVGWLKGQSVRSSVTTSVTPTVDSGGTFLLSYHIISYRIV